MSATSCRVFALMIDNDFFRPRPSFGGLPVRSRFSLSRNTSALKSLLLYDAAPYDACLGWPGGPSTFNPSNPACPSPFLTPDSVRLNCVNPRLFLFDNFEGVSGAPPAFTPSTGRHSLRLLGVLFLFLLSFRLELGARSRPPGSSNDRGPPSWERPRRERSAVLFLELATCGDDSKEAEAPATEGENALEDRKNQPPFWFGERGETGREGGTW